MAGIGAKGGADYKFASKGARVNRLGARKFDVNSWDISLAG